MNKSELSNKIVAAINEVIHRIVNELGTSQ